MTVRSLSGLDPRDVAEIVARTAGLHEALRGARIVVTGATGWFGTWLLDALVAIDWTSSLGLRIVAVSRSPDAFARRFPELAAADAIEWIAADVRDPDLAFGDGITHVVHGATDASARLNGEEPDRMFDTIVSGTRNALRATAAHPGARFLLIGSGAVYGAQPDGVERLAEDWPGAPDPLDAANAYAGGKRAAEHLVAVWHASRGVEATIARCFAFVGPHMPFDAHFAVGNFLRDAVDGTEVRVAGDGTPRRTYLYMTDLVVWLLKILVGGRPARAYNVGGDAAVTIEELARLCAAAGGDRVPVVVDGRSGGRDYVPSVARASAELGLSIHVPLTEALRRTVDWKQSVHAPLPVVA